MNSVTLPHRVRTTQQALISRKIPRVTAMLKRSLVMGGLALATIRAVGGDALRAPAVPLVTHDPYFSIWSPADHLTDVDTTHWTKKPHRLTGELRVHGSSASPTAEQRFRFMGKTPENVPALQQTSVEILPTRTVYSFQGPGIALKLTFMTPALPEDIDLASRPITYVTAEARSTDGRSHGITLRFAASGEIAVNDPKQQQVTGAQLNLDGLSALKLGSVTQPVLARKGDDLRIDWGYLYLAAPKAQVSTASLTGFPAPGQPALAGETSASLELDFGTVGAEPVARWLMLAYDDEYSIKYFDTRLRPYWRRNGDDAAALLKKAAADYESLITRCARFDDELLKSLQAAGGDHYAQLCALAYRQTFAGNKIVADANGQPLMFPKENFSNGCIGTVDVLFPQAPFFLLFSPGLTKAMLVPILDYAASSRWKFDYAPHDLGTYPHATGQVYGGGERTDENQMPVEESGNMLIILAALARAEGNADFATNYWPTLTKWADYCVREGLDPANQLCSADMFGHLPRCANLALKAIIGIGGYAQLCEMAHRPDAARKYMAIARDYAKKWQELAADDGHTRLAYHLPGSWGMKHNLVWDHVLGLNLFPTSVADNEIAWYLKVQNKYGLPVDNRTDTSLIDWAMWSIAPARRQADFEALVEPLFRYVNETPSRVPLCDWFITTDARQKGFQARPVVGGIYIRLLAGAPMWKRWFAAGANASGPWAPIVLPGQATETVATAQSQAVAWRYTTNEPPADWIQPGFDDSGWKEGPAGFGTKGTPGGVIRTEWNTKQIWLRRTFTLPDRPLNRPRFLLAYDEDPELFLNGKPAAKLPGWTTSYEEAEIDPAAAATLKPGNNLLAVHAHQTYGGQYIDAGIIETADALPTRKLFDFPVRDTSICVGPDQAYYLTGTTGAPSWWDKNEGIRIWRSTDLTNWVPLGLVWTIERNGTWQKQFVSGKRAVWAPEIHYLKGTFWLTYCMNYPKGGTGILRSTSGKAEGPYEDVKPDGPLTDQIDASLFQDEDGKVYFVYQDGKIARLKDDMTGLAEEPRLLKPSNRDHVGFEGAFLTRIGGRYQLVCAEFNQRAGTSTYDCMIASSENLYGPYGEAYLALPHAGHNMLFKDLQGRWWSTFFGNDPLAPWRERPGLLPIVLGSNGKISASPTPVVAEAPKAAPKPNAQLPGLRKLTDTPLRDTSICLAADGNYYLTGTVEPFWAYNEGICLWKSKDLQSWEPLGMVWRYGASPWHKKYLEAKKPLWAPEVHYMKDTFWLTYSIPGWDGTGKTSGSGLLKSTSGKAEGPYEDVQPGERLGDEIDASLFQDDDGQVYFLWHSGKIARMKPDMSGLAEPYHWLKMTTSDPDPKHHSGLCAGIFGQGSFDHVGYEGMFLFKANGRYYFTCSESMNGRYSCMATTSTNIYGPYGPRYEAIPHGGHNMFFHDKAGAWWSTYFGSDSGAPWQERPGILPIRFDESGRLQTN